MFNTAFPTSLRGGPNIEEASENGNAPGDLAATVRGDMEALPTWKDVKTFIESSKKALFLR